MIKSLYAAVLEIRGYIVGDANSRSGFHIRDANGRWERRGWSNIRSFGLDHSGDSILMAAGNGVLISHDRGISWRVTTDWRITEVLDVAVSPFDDRLVIASTAHGFWRSTDLCQTWSYVPVPEQNRFCQSIVFDQTSNGLALAASETGILRSSDNGSSWSPTSVTTKDESVRHLCQDSRHPDNWWAASTNLGIIRSLDSGATWTPVAGTDSAPLYCVMNTDDIIAATGYQTGLLLSVDHGASWTQVDFPDLSLSGHAIVLDPADSNRLIVGTTTDGLFVYDRSSEQWSDAGLPDATVRGLYAW